MGLTGTPDEKSAAAEDAFIVQYERIETPDSLAEYTMDHTSLLYLMDEDWKLQTFFAEADANPEYIAQCLAQHHRLSSVFEIGAVLLRACPPEKAR